MKTAVLLLLCLLLPLQLSAAEQPLVPAALNRVLPLIRSGMTVQELEGILATAYPEMSPLVGDWSGQAGTVFYQLDHRYSLSIACMDAGGTRIVHSNLQFVLYERPANRRVTLNVFEWQK